MTQEERTLALANEIASALAARAIPTAVIGGIAVAVRGYPRGTEDLDLAVCADLNSLRAIAREFQDRGYTITLGEPDAEDPLGGVLTVEASGADPIQVVNYANPYRVGSGALASEAVTTASPQLLLGLAVVDLAHLIALKLYAGGPKSMLDVTELLARNPDADRNSIRAVCERFGLAQEWDDLIAQ
jgi:hypothetical protein